MSLTLYKRGNVWHVRGSVAGETVRESTGTADRAKAEAWKARRENAIWDRRIHGERATVSLLEAAVSYAQHRGPSAGDRAYINRLLDHFCPGWRDGVNEAAWTRCGTIDQAACDRAVNAICGDGAAPSTKVRSVITPLNAILTHAAKRGWCDRPAFDRPRQPKGRTSWMTPTQAQSLLLHCADHLRPLLVFLLGTGARMSEGLYLDWRDVDLRRSVAILRDTKNGKDRPASMPSGVVAALSALKHREGPVFLHPVRMPGGLSEMAPYADTGKEHGGQIKTGFDAACRRAGLAEVVEEIPWTDSRGIARVKTTWRNPFTPHDLRHTWATWFYGLCRDPMLLRAEGGWGSLALVERYAHLMPSDVLPDIHTIWGGRHPVLGDLPTSAADAQRLTWRA